MRTRRLLLGSLTAAAALATVLIPTATSNATVAPSVLPAPTIHYTFDNTLVDSGGASTLTELPACTAPDANACNATTSFGTDANGGYWAWTSTAPRGGGFRVHSAVPIGDTYTMTLKFSFNMVGPSWRKIIDYKNRVSDTGFYFIDGTIRFYNLGDASTQVYPANTVMDLVAVRDNATSTFTVYAMGTDKSLTQLIQINDPTGESIPEVISGQTLLGFFFDDTATSREATDAGKVYDIQIWENTALTPEQIQEALIPNPPTNVVVTPGDGSITVSWDPSPGATSYTATAQPGGASCTAQAPATTCVITGVSNDAAYDVSVVATGPGGSSSGTPAPGPVTPTTSTTSTTTTTAVDPVHPAFTG